MNLARYWWVFVVQGVVAIAFAGVGLMLPAAAVVAFVFLFGVFAALSGLLSTLAALSGGGDAYPRWVLWLQGAAGVAAAAAAFLWPGLTALLLLYVVAWWALITGVLNVAAAIRLRRETEGEWRLALAGGASIAFAALVFVVPAAAAVAVWALIVAFAFVWGTALIALGLDARRWRTMLAG